MIVSYYYAFRYFLLTVAFITLQTTTALVVSSVLLVEAFAYPDAFDRRGM